MELTEKTLSSREIYRGRVIRVRVDEVALPNGNTSLREIVEHPGGVGILALDEENRVYLVRQYRYAFAQTLLEIPAGKREAGEEPFLTAQRELREEIGAEAAHWESLGQIIASPGCYDEVLHLYLARGLSFGAQQLDEDEFLNVFRMPLRELVRQVMAGESPDSKTQIAALKVWQLLQTDEIQQTDI